MLSKKWAKNLLDSFCMHRESFLHFFCVKFKKIFLKHFEVDNKNVHNYACETKKWRRDGLLDLCTQWFTHNLLFHYFFYTVCDFSRHSFPLKLRNIHAILSTWESNVIIEVRWMGNVDGWHACKAFQFFLIQPVIFCYDSANYHSKKKCF